MVDKFYTPDELASMLKVTRNAIYNWIADGTISAVKIGRTVRIPVAEVDRLISQNTTSPKAKAGTRRVAMPA